MQSTQPRSVEIRTRYVAGAFWICLKRYGVLARRLTKNATVVAVLAPGY